MGGDPKGIIVQVERPKGSADVHVQSMLDVAASAKWDPREVDEGYHSQQPHWSLDPFKLSLVTKKLPDCFKFLNAKVKCGGA